jgi:hypothetical protein
MKKRVAILYSGQMRSNSLNSNSNKDDIILQSTSNYFLTDDFKEKYDYDVFFSVDNIDIDAAKQYFGENLKNINITESDYYMTPIDDKILPYEYFHNKYLNSYNFLGFNNHIQALYQYYRMYNAFNLCKNYKKEMNINYDYLVRIRPDIRIMQNVMPLFELLETGGKKIIMEHEQLCILDSSLEDMFEFINYYGNFTEPMGKNWDIYRSLTRTGVHYENQITLFAPEKQFIDYIYFLFNKKGLCFIEDFLGLIYPSFNLLYRGDNVYAHIKPTLLSLIQNNNYVWQPFSPINDPYCNVNIKHQL